RVELVNKETGEVTEQDVFLGDFPWMTDKGTFVINGAERVVVSQLVRSPGVYFTAVDDPTTGRRLFYAKLIPNRGAWLEFETSNKDVISVKVDRKRKLPVTTLLRAIEFSSNDEIKALFTAIDNDPEHQYVQSTLDRDPTTNTNEGLVEVYKRLRPGDPPTIDNARNLGQSLHFNSRRYDLAKVGRYKRNRKLGLDGLSRERAGFDVRDVHYSHYGRICPIETPEGPNIGLIGSLATYARVNPYGFIESPFRRIVKDGKGKPRVSDEIVFLTADEQELATVVQANARLDDTGFFLDERVQVHRGDAY